MTVRNALPGDIPAILKIYSHAREFMAENGNPHQWGDSSWPPEHLVREDVAVKRSYVVDDGGEVLAVFCFMENYDDPTYRVIEDGKWTKTEPYGVVHRLASSGKRKGIAKTVLSWAVEKAGYLRVDTHPDNKVMLSVLPALGFRRCGIIHVLEDDYPRIAFDASRD